MGRKLLNLSLEDHIKIAQEIFHIQLAMQKITKEIGSKCGFSKNLHKRARAVMDKIDELRCDLDTDYCKVVDDQTFHKMGFIYYENVEFWINYHKEKKEKGKL